MNCARACAMVRFSAGLLACVLLAGCAHLFQDDALKAGCPALRTYTQGTLDRVSVELDTLGPNSAVSGLLKDYRQLRTACRTQ